MKLIKITQLPEFNGWDLGDDLKDITLITEIRNAWMDYHKKYSCPLIVSPKTLYPVRDFCKRINIPFRYFIQLSIPFLEQFPQPWQLNLHWLQDEIETIWLQTKDVSIPESISSLDDSQKILKAKSERTRQSNR